jgi:uncharacterized damage-inducible protein DinB
MIDPTPYRQLAEYNAWMTGKLYETCAQMTDEERKADKGAFFKSIHSTLNHLLFADRAWMSRFTEHPYEYFGMGEDIYADFPELRTAHLAIAKDIKAWSATLTPAWLSGTLKWTSTGGDRTTERPCWLVVTHLFNHQTHHRGQITTLLTQSGLDVGVTDLPFMPGAGL